MTITRSTVLRATLALGVLAVALVSIQGCRGGWKGFMAHFHARKAKSAPNTTDYADNVDTLVNGSQLPILRWPDFSDFQPQVQKFYDDRNYELAWIRDGKPTPATTQLIHLFISSAQKGLNPEDYDASRWPARLQGLEKIRVTHDSSDAAQATVAGFDAAVTITAMRYCSDLHLGRINPQALNFDIDVPKRRNDFDIETLLNDQIVDSDDVPSVVATLEPQNPLYLATEQALPHYLQLAQEQTMSPSAPLPPLAEGEKSIAPGGFYPALEQLQQRLDFEGYASSVPPRAYDEDLAADVKKFQQSHGLVADGHLGQATLDALNVPMSRRVQQIDDALERWRWLPDNYVNPRVLVNLPEFQLRAYEADRSLAFTMRVVDGEAKGNHDTPTFVRLMRYVVFRPFWNLPPSIVKKEIVGHVAKDKSYLANHGYIVVKGNTPVTDYTVADLEHSRYEVRQMPGPKNSLGLVKFLFPNEYDVYMHSTPELNLFNLTRRDRSHGCVRLQHADKMALWVLSNDQDDPINQTKWTDDTISDAMNGDNDNRFVTLKTPLPVVIAYFTAMVDEQGSTNFYTDIYGYDQQLENALAKGRPYPAGELKIDPKLTPGETE